MNGVKFNCSDCPTNPETATVIYRDEASRTKCFCNADCRQRWHDNREAQLNGQENLRLVK